MVRVDRDIYDNPEKIKQLIKDELSQISVPDNNTETTNGDFRYKGVTIDGLDKKLDIDLTYSIRSNEIEYSTEECIKDRLKTIQNNSEEDYKSGKLTAGALFDNDDYDSFISQDGEMLIAISNYLNGYYAKECRKKQIIRYESASTKIPFFANSTGCYGYFVNKKQVTIDPYAARIVRKIFKMRIEGISHKRIADYLNKTSKLHIIIRDVNEV